MPSNSDNAMTAASSSRINALGWQAQVKLEDGLALAYADFVSKIGR
jgi:nucleoside-diphosphate-sugar epimerase